MTDKEARALAKRVRSVTLAASGAALEMLLVQAAQAGAGAEREACAALADGMAHVEPYARTVAADQAERIAAAIRARA